MIPSVSALILFSCLQSAHADNTPFELWTVNNYKRSAPNSTLLAEFHERQKEYINVADTSPIISALTGKAIDRRYLLNQLDNIETDNLADFRLIELIRIMGLTHEYDDIILPAITKLPFWLTPGDTIRNYWSENHMIMWMSSAWILQEQQHIPVDETLRNRLLHWLKLKSQYGYYEFFSPIYAPFTLSGLLNLYDFAEDQEIKQLAAEAAIILLNDLILASNDKGIFAPVAGRAGSGNYINVTDQSVDEIIRLLTGLGEKLNRASGKHVGILATTTLDVSPALANYREHFNIRYHIGHNINDIDTIHVQQNERDKTIFQWSAGGYFHPKTADKTYKLITKYDMWDHPNFSGFSMLGKPAKATKQYLNAMSIAAKFGAEVLSDISQGSVISGVDVDLYKHKSLLLSSIRHFNPGRVGYQAWPWVAVTGKNAVYTESGNKEDQYVDNSHLPYVEQEGNVALIMYKPNAILYAIGPYLGFKDFDVKLHWPRDSFDESIELGHWLIARENDSYIALFRPCITVDKCTNTLQTWAVIVGDAETYNSFDHFISVIKQAHVESKWHFDLNNVKYYFISSIQIDKKTINHNWKAHVEDVVKMGPFDKDLLN